MPSDPWVATTKCHLPSLYDAGRPDRDRLAGPHPELELPARREPELPVLVVVRRVREIAVGGEGAALGRRRLEPHRDRVDRRRRVIMRRDHLPGRSVERDAAARATLHGTRHAIADPGRAVVAGVPVAREVRRRRRAGGVAERPVRRRMPWRAPWARTSAARSTSWSGSTSWSSVPRALAQRGGRVLVLDLGRGELGAEERRVAQAAVEGSVGAVGPAVIGDAAELPVAHVRSEPGCWRSSATCLPSR